MEIRLFTRKERPATVRALLERYGDKVVLMVAAETAEQRNQPGFQPLIETPDGVVWAREARDDEHVSLLVIKNPKTRNNEHTQACDNSYTRLHSVNDEPGGPIVWVCML